MSAANAAARKRRAAPEPAQQLRPNQQQPTAAPAPLTLPQVISLLDNRIVKLEVFMKETKEKPLANPANVNVFSPTNTELEITNNDVIFDEFNSRFEILASEIANLKDMLLKLQSYTMDVNKTLMEERINVFSDLGTRDNADPSNENALENGTFMTIDNAELSSVNFKNLVTDEFSMQENM